MKEHIKDFLLVAIPALLITILFMQLVAARGVAKVNNNLKEEIEYLESRIELYESNEEWFEDYIELIGEIWHQEAQIEVLKERIYWLNKYEEAAQFNKEYAEQMYNDFEVLIEAMFDYVIVNGNLNDFSEYFKSNYSEVFNRIDNVYEVNH